MSDSAHQALLDLAARLGTTPARVLVAAASLVESGSGNLDAVLARLAAEATQAPGPADEIAALLLTPVAGFARDNLATLLAPAGPGQT